jgi:hypothetical protein
VYTTGVGFVNEKEWVGKWPVGIQEIYKNKGTKGYYQINFWEI